MATPPEEQLEHTRAGVDRARAEAAEVDAGRRPVGRRRGVASAGAALGACAAIALACAGQARTPRLPGAPDSLAGFDRSDCLRFEVIDTLREGDAVHVVPGRPVLEGLPFGSKGIASARLLERDVPELELLRELERDFATLPSWQVSVELEREAAEAFESAMERHPDRQIRISRPGFDSVEPLLPSSPIEGGRFSISVYSEADGRRLADMLSAPCR